MKFLSAFFGLCLLSASLVFALSNGQSAIARLWPFDIEIEAPLGVMVLSALAVGLVFGGGLVWLGYLPHRFKTRRIGKDLVTLGDRVIELEHELERHLTSRESKLPPLLTGPRWRFWKKF